MSNHTSGPWRVEDGTTLIWGACNPDDRSTYGMGYPITECRISPASSSAWCKGPSFDEGEANARLIAAAPDLLEALLWIVENDESGELMYDISGNGPAKAVGRMGGKISDVALSAIAKATGQEGGAL